MLKVKLLMSSAKVPTCAHPGEDLGFDLYALYRTALLPNRLTQIETGIAVEMEGFGFLMRERSSWAKRGVVVCGGTIDAGYRGELLVNLMYHRYVDQFQNACYPDGDQFITINPGDRIAQLVPIRPATSELPLIVEGELSHSARGTGAYGSTGR